MRVTRLILTGLVAAMLAFGPNLAFARAGSGSSMGSRGSMTYSAPPTTRTAPYAAQPMQRSITPSSPSPGYNANPGYGAPGFQQRSPFMSGLMGGLIGAGIGGLLFGHGFFGGGMGGFGMAHFLGFLLQIFLIVMVVRFLFRLFRGNGQPAFAGMGRMFSPPGQAPSGGGFGGGGGPGVTPIQIGPQDYTAFEQSLQAIQAAWSNHDLASLGQLATPEMVSYFGEQLADQASRGVRNTVTDVRLLQGDLSEAWAEQGREYATVAMRFSMIDVTRDGAGRIVDGSASEHVTATELWTFLRAAGGGWVLSAIQQTR